MMRVLALIFVLGSISLSSCKRGLDVDVEDIDAYVYDVTDPNAEFEVVTGLRFSKEDSETGELEHYQVLGYFQNDTAKLVLEEIEYSDRTIGRNTFYMKGMPVYIEEYETSLNAVPKPFVERHIYLNGVDILKAEERKAEYEWELMDQTLTEVEVDIDDYDFDKPFDALNQEGDFEMKFGEFMTVDPQTYLILENEESGYNIALFIMEGDMLLDNLYENPDAFQGNTIFVYHEFMDMQGIERMIYRGGILIEGND